jgi:hypothetical protein
MTGQFFTRPLVIAVAIAAGSCAQAEPVSVPDIEHYTGIKLCPDTVIRDLTTKEERNTFVGFSFHVELAMSAACRASFEEQLANMSSECAPLTVEGCFVDASEIGPANITVHPISGGRYDVRFWE